MSTAFAAPVALSRITVQYSTASGVPLSFDAALPEGPGPFPAVIIVHGGGWVRGDRRVDVAPLFKPLEEAGMAWFSIDYRLSTDITQFGVGLEDVRNAVRFIKAHASEYQIDPDRIALLGESAGGQLAAMAALDPAEATSVKAVVAMYTPTDLVTLANESTFIPKQFRDALRGTPFEAMILDRLRQLSPVNNIKPGAPPFLLIHGTADRLVPFAQSTDMCARLKATGAQCELYPIEGGGHGMRWWDSSQAWKTAMVKWLKLQLSRSVA